MRETWEAFRATAAAITRLGMESTTSVSVSSMAASSENPIVLYIAWKATFEVVVLISLTFFIGHWERGEVFSFVTLTDKLDY